MPKPEVVSPAGNLASLKAAIDAGADAVYLGFNDATNARNFEGLNFTMKDIEEGVKYARARAKKVFLAINTFPQGDTYPKWYKAVDSAMELKADAIIIANLGILNYARKRYPDAILHLSTQASASNYESINFYKKHFNIKRVVLPRVLTVAEMAELKKKTDVEIEVFALGGLCINIEGRCYLSSYVTGSSTNTDGACSPSRFVKFISSPSPQPSPQGERGFHSGGDKSLSITLNDMLLNKLGPGEFSPYPTCCKGRYLRPDGEAAYVMEEPESLNVLEILPSLIMAGVSAFKIEGRQRTKSYVAAMTGVLREAIDACMKDPASYRVRPEWNAKTLSTFEGSKQTLGGYVAK